MSSEINPEDGYPEEDLPIFEAIWGKGFISPGGPEEVAEILDGIDLTNAKVLDVGCGTGGVDIILARDYGAVHVTGIDVESHLVDVAQAYVSEAGLSENITFQLVEPGPLPFGDVTFDIVFSKDALLHIPDKTLLFSEVLRVLRTGGLFIASDWLRGEYDVLSSEMTSFLKLAGHDFDMVTLSDYESKLKDAGFVDVALRDRNTWYRDEAEHELERLKGSLKPEIISNIGSNRLQELEESWISFWQAMVEVLRTGELRPAHIKAHKSI